MSLLRLAIPRASGTAARPRIWGSVTHRGAPRQGSVRSLTRPEDTDPGKRGRGAPTRSGTCHTMTGAGKGVGSPGGPLAAMAGEPLAECTPLCLLLLARHCDVSQSPLLTHGASRGGPSRDREPRSPRTPSPWPTWHRPGIQGLRALLLHRCPRCPRRPCHGRNISARTGTWRLRGSPVALECIPGCVGAPSQHTVPFRQPEG